MGCNDYNLHLDGSSGEQPTPEYNIYLDGVGVNGYSPTVDIVNENTASFQIQTNDINGSELTSPIPKLSYLQSDYVSNTSLASTLANYSTTAQIASDYLKVDGSNADNPITINNIKIEPMTLSSINSSLYLQAGNGSIILTPSNGQKVYYTPYNTSVSNKYEIAVKDDISDATITLTQGGVTKGTFTLNGSATTIDLDAGGGSITNPLHIGYTDEIGTRSLNLGVDETTSKVISSFSISTSGSYFGIPIKLLTGSTNPLVLTENQEGLYNLSLNIDDDTIKVNQDGELYAVGGGGTTYTAGTGIDITGGVISIDTSVVAQLSDIPDTTNMVTTNTAQTISGVKTFSSETHHLGVITFDSAMLNPIIRGMSGSSHRNMIYRMGNDSAIIVGNSNDTIDLKGSGTRPTYNSNALALSSDIPTNSDYVDLTTDQTVGGTKTFSNDQKFGGYIYLDGSSNAQGVVHKVGNTRKELVLRNNSASMVYVGNTSDALNLRGSGTRPSYYTNGTSKDIAFTNDIPTDYVTLTTNQTSSGNRITGNKQFMGTVYLTGSKTVLQNNDNSANLGYLGGTTDFEINTYSNKNINLKPNGTGEVQYNGNKIATINDIPSISNLADKDLSNLSTTGQDIIDGKADTDLSNLTIVNTPITNTAIDPFINKITDADITAAPSSDINTGLLFRDNNNNTLAGFTALRFTNGVQATQITALNEISGTNKYAYLNVHVDSNGSDFADASNGVRNAIAQWSGHLGGAFNVAFDASGNFTPTTNGYLYVAIRTVGVGSIAYVSCNGLVISLGFDQASYVISGVLPVSTGYYAHIDYFNGAYFEAAKFVPLGGY